MYEFVIIYCNIVFQKQFKPRALPCDLQLQMLTPRHVEDTAGLACGSGFNGDKLKPTWRLILILYKVRQKSCSFDLPVYSQMHFLVIISTCTLLYTVFYKNKIRFSSVIWNEARCGRRVRHSKPPINVKYSKLRR